MSIRIEKVSEGLYVAELTLPDMPEVKSEWSSDGPLNLDELIHELRNRGAHPIDIGDVFYAADPDWLKRK